MNSKIVLEPTGEQMTLFSPVGSLNYANPTLLQENDLEKKMTATSGRKCLDAFGRLSRAGSWAKTFSELLIGTGDWYSTKCRLTWKLKGTKYKRMYFQLAPSTLPIGEIEFGLLPTPTVIQGGAVEVTGKNKSNTFSAGLHDLAKSGLLPTPTARDLRSTHAENSQAYQDRMQHPRGVPLVEHMQREMDGKSFQLNPPFVAEMMGFPPDWTELPFLNGATNPSKPTETP